MQGVGPTLQDSPEVPESLDGQGPDTAASPTAVLIGTTSGDTAEQRVSITES